MNPITPLDRLFARLGLDLVNQCMYVDSILGGIFGIKWAFVAWVAVLA